MFLSWEMDALERRTFLSWEVATLERRTSYYLSCELDALIHGRSYLMVMGWMHSSETFLPCGVDALERRTVSSEADALERRKFPSWGVNALKHGHNLESSKHHNAT
jgi:hypothetical protein